MATIGTRLYSWFFGQKIGEDQHGNQYFHHRKVSANGVKKRWVIFKGIVEPSKVPPLWHCWLHYMLDRTPKTHAQEHAWQSERQPNLTGTKLAYFPEGHIYSGGERAPATGDYEPWKP